MTGSCIKGTAFQAVVDDLQRLAKSGALGAAEIAQRLQAPDVELLQSGILPGSWYPIDVYRRMLELLVAKEAGAQREKYLHGRGAAAAERILKMGLYNHLEAALRAAERKPDRWIEQVGRVMTTLSPAMFNFSKWEFRAHDDARHIFTLEVTGARDLPEETRILLEGFIASLFVPFTSDRVEVRSRRPQPDLMHFDGYRERSGK